MIIFLRNLVARRYRHQHCNPKGVRMETRLYTRTNPNNGQIEIKHYEIIPNARPDEIGPVFQTHFWGTEAPADFFANHDYYDDVDVLCLADIYSDTLDGPLPDFLETTWKEHDAEGWVLLPTPEPHEYTCAGSPVAVLRADGSNIIEIAALPGSRTVEGSLERITLEEALGLINSLTDAIEEEKWA
ncbi:hypothetical protein HD597_006820 [Nonomuraea thailandensis]|uniref:Uncharacterized protein n=1 Tax=Nonomuraea thailandensis TaxID=1188745 RepID=A0A9X2K4W7_9ACTN|nr:hypothetical protein [Nonomuraea thailandensis]MCP2359800.1 hypothetical protein [Nonomuraea thailandensis]